MRLYAELAKRSFRRWSTYRAATVAGIFTNSVFGFIRASVLLAVLRSNPGAGGLDAVGGRSPTASSPRRCSRSADVFGGDQEIALRVRTGDVVGDLYRPVDFQAWWLASDLGRAAFQLSGRGVPIMLVGALTYGIEAPADVGAGALFVVSLLLAVIVGFALKFLVNLSSFWLLDIRGTHQLMVTAALVLLRSGRAPQSLPRLARAVRRAPCRSRASSSTRSRCISGWRTGLPPWRLSPRRRSGPSRSFGSAGSS